MNQMTKLENLCIKWLNKNFNPMEPFIMKEYPDYIFHMKDGRCILQHNKKNGYVYVSYREIWKFFESYFSMSNQQIKDITKIWVEEHYKVGVTSTNPGNPGTRYWVEEQYKMGVTSTFRGNGDIRSIVEEHYKMGITTIYESNPVINDVVEENYKMVVTETKGVDTYGMMKVKEQYNIQTNG
jgi:hypothetical protein